MLYIPDVMHVSTALRIRIGTILFAQLPCRVQSQGLDPLLSPVYGALQGFSGSPQQRHSDAIELEL